MFFSVLFIVGALVLIGCSNPTSEGEKADNTVYPSPSGPTSTGTPTKREGGERTLAATYPTAESLQDMITRYNPIIVDGPGTTIAAAGSITVPKGKTLRLTGNLKLETGTILIVEDAAGLEGTGSIDVVSGATITFVADADVITKFGTSPAPSTGTITGVPFKSIADITTAGATIAVRGPVSIESSGSDTAIASSVLNGSTLYVAGDLTVSADVANTATAITVVGNLTANKELKGATIKVTGNVEAGAKITSSTSLTAEGEVKFTGTTAQNGIAALNAGSLVSPTADITASGAIAVSGDITAKGINATTIRGRNITTTGTVGASGGITATGNVIATGGTITGAITASTGTVSVETVIGNITSPTVTASGKVTGTITATGGTVTFTGNTLQDGLSGLTATNVTSSVAIITVSNGGIMLTGTLKGTSVTLDGTGTLTGAGSLDLSGDLKLGTGASTIKGAIGQDLTVGTAGVTISGDTSIGRNIIAGGDITVSADIVLTIASSGHTGVGKIIAVATGASLTIGDTGGYTTAAGGATAANLATATAGLTTERTGITSPTAVTLDAAFGTVPANAGTVIGSVILSNTTATAVQDSADGSSGTDVTLVLNSGFSLVGATVTGEDAVSSTDDIKGASFALTLDSDVVKISDSGATGTGDKYGIVMFAGLKLQHTSGLIDATLLPTISIGVKTIR
jgi:hypothetical protein